MKMSILLEGKATLFANEKLQIIMRFLRKAWKTSCIFIFEPSLEPDFSGFRPDPLWVIEGQVGTQKNER